MRRYSDRQTDILSHCKKRRQSMLTKKKKEEHTYNLTLDFQKIQVDSSHILIDRQKGRNSDGQSDMQGKKLASGIPRHMKLCKVKLLWQ